MADFVLQEFVILSINFLAPLEQMQHKECILDRSVFVSGLALKAP